VAYNRRLAHPGVAEVSDELNVGDVPAPSRADAESTAHMRTMAEHLDAILALAGLEDFRATGRLPAALFYHWEAALASFDAYVAHIIAAEGWQVSCRAGCSACCHDLARGVGTLEAVALYRHVRPWPEIGALYEACGENMVAFQRRLAAELERDPRPLEAEDPRASAAHLAYNRERRPCAFLDRDTGRCRVYPVRPLVCRSFFSLSPATFCEPDHPRYLDREARIAEPFEGIKQRVAAIDARLGVRTLNFLSGAFVSVAGATLNGRPIEETTGQAPGEPPEEANGATGRD
jgi:Fe-S-cluster containining protein